MVMKKYFILMLLSSSIVAMSPSCKKKDEPKTYTCTCGTETMRGLSEAEKNTQAMQDCTNASLAKTVGKWTCE
jgi:hypothetical protein